jgi:opacity protein-like surface antigen
MKKIILTSCFLLGLLLTFNTASYAQEGRIQVGPGLAYGNEAENLGISVDGYYTINEQFRAGTALTYFFPDKTDVPGGGELSYNYFAIDLNGNYIFHREEEFMAYGIAGLNILNVGADVEGADGTDYDTDSNTELGLNLGAGIEYGVDFGNLFGELKFTGIGGDYDQLVLGAGVRFDIQ